MRAIYGLYDDPIAAQRAVNSLRAAGTPDSDITIQSSEPFEHYEFGQRDQKTYIWWIAVGGGILGFMTGALLTSLTQLAWPLNTGGMPIVSIWPNLIPTFELTFLGAVLATVATLVVSTGLFRKGSDLYDPAISDGLILVGVAQPPEARVAAIESALASSGGELKRVS